MKAGIVVLGLGLLVAAPVWADQTVKIGFAGPLTGPVGHLGKDEEYGARLAIDDANAKGLTIGGNKVRFELVSEDDQGDPRQATTVAQRLVDESVAGVVGHVTSGAAIPASRIYEQAGIPVITPSATSPKLTEQNYKVTFRVIANDLQQGKAMAAYAAKDLKAHRVAVIDDRTAYGQGLADAFAAEAGKNGLQIVGREFTNDKATDFLAILTKLKASKPDAIFYGGMDAQGAPLVKQMRQLGLQAKLLGGDGICTGEMITLAGTALGTDAYCTQAGLAMERMPGGKDFLARFQKRFGVGVQLYAPYSFDATNALIQAMQKADSVQPEKYLPALHTISFKGITGSVAFDARGDSRDGAVTLYHYTGGAWKALP